MVVRLELVVALPKALTDAEQAFGQQADRHDRDLNDRHTISRRSTTSNGQVVKGLRSNDNTIEATSESIKEELKAPVDNPKCCSVNPNRCSETMQPSCAASVR